MKLMFGWRGDDAAVLHDAGLRSALARAGVTRWQVNVDDDPVAGALRMATGSPYGAIVSVWLDASAEADVVALLDGVGARDGWEVEETVRLEPPEVADGVRHDALANVALLRRPADLDEGTWRHRWQVDHTPVAVATQGTFGYVQNRVMRPVTDTTRAAEQPVAALVEELFPTEALSDVHAFYGSGGDDAELTRRITDLMTSCARFGADRDLDLVPSSRYTWDLRRTPLAEPATT